MNRRKERKIDLHVYISKKLKDEIQNTMEILNNNENKEYTVSDFVRAVLFVNIEKVKNGEITSTEIENTLQQYKELI